MSRWHASARALELAGGLFQALHFGHGRARALDQRRRAMARASAARWLRSCACSRPRRAAAASRPGRFGSSRSLASRAMVAWASACRASRLVDRLAGAARFGGDELHALAHAGFVGRGPRHVGLRRRRWLSPGGGPSATRPITAALAVAMACSKPASSSASDCDGALRLRRPARAVPDLALGREDAGGFGPAAAAHHVRAAVDVAVEGHDRHAGHAAPARTASSSASVIERLADHAAQGGGERARPILHDARQRARSPAGRGPRPAAEPSGDAVADDDEAAAAGALAPHQLRSRRTPARGCRRRRARADRRAWLRPRARSAARPRGSRRARPAAPPGRIGAGQHHAGRVAEAGRGAASTSSSERRRAPCRPARARACRTSRVAPLVLDAGAASSDSRAERAISVEARPDCARRKRVGWRGRGASAARSQLGAEVAGFHFEPAERRGGALALRPPRARSPRSAR